MHIGTFIREHETEPRIIPVTLPEPVKEEPGIEVADWPTAVPVEVPVTAPEKVAG